MKMLSAILGTLVIVVLWAAQARAAEESVISGSEASGVVSVVDVRSEDGVVSGIVLNNSNELARNVQLLIRHPWLWNNERHPGADSPGQAELYVVPGPVPPHGNVKFQYQGSPLPERSDGRFTTQVEVVGFTQVGLSDTQPGFQP